MLALNTIDENAPRVLPSLELWRVRRLRRREHGNVDELVDALTEYLRTEDGTMRLWPHQAIVLTELHDYGGVVTQIGVGGGKTLISYLAPSVVEATNPVLVVPAKLRKKTWRDYTMLAQHWRAPANIDGMRSIYNIRVVSYEKISRVGGIAELDGADLLILDEAHKIKSLSAACTKKILRFLDENPECRFLAMTGTLVNRSILDAWHMLLRSHGATAMPLPSSREEASTWAAAVDVTSTVNVLPHALAYLDPDHPQDQPPRPMDRDEARTLLGDRIFSTPGCVRTLSPSTEVSLSIEFVQPPFPPECQPLLTQMDNENIAPDGDELLPHERFRYIRELVLGFFYYWDPPAPYWWLEARKNWKRFVRGILEENRPGLESEFAVATAIQEGRLHDGGVHERWLEVRDDFTPNSVPRWLTFDPLHQIVKDVKKIGPCIVWVHHVCVGRKLQDLTGWKYYGAKGLDDEGTFIEDAKGDEPVIASIESNCEGRNLQFKFSKNYIVTPVTMGSQMEQLMGRTHRAGQEADNVEFYVRFGHREIKLQFLQAVKDAIMQQRVLAQPQRLLLADYVSPDDIPPALWEEMQRARADVRAVEF